METRTSATGLWTNVVNGGVYSGATTATLTITEATSAMNGYQYRSYSLAVVQPMMPPMLQPLPLVHYRLWLT